MVDKRTGSAYWALRIAFGVVPIVAGLDKFTNVLANWEAYLSPLAARLLPVSPGLFMRGVGIVEIVVGAGILFGFARWFGWIAAAWLLAIALNLVSSGRYLDVAARDVVMAIGAYALARLAPLHEEASVREVGRQDRPAQAHA